MRTKAQERTLEDLKHGVILYIRKDGRLEHLRMPAMDLPSVAVVAKDVDLKDVVTNNGKYTWRHFEIWSEKIEARQKHKSILSEWLMSISDCLKEEDGE